MPNSGVERHMRFKGVRSATLVATEFGTKLLTPPTCTKNRSPAMGIGQNAGEIQSSDFLAHEPRRARAVAQSIPGILPFAIAATMADIRWRVKSNFRMTQFSAMSIGPFQE
jgi:hypothetical protein